MNVPKTQRIAISESDEVCAVFEFTAYDVDTIRSRYEYPDNVDHLAIAMVLLVAFSHAYDNVDQETPAFVDRIARLAITEFGMNKGDVPF